MTDAFDPAAFDGLPEGPWRVCGYDRGGCKCGQVWSANDAHIATAHHVSQAAPDDLESQEVYLSSETQMKTVARAIAALPDMWVALDNTRQEVDALRAENERLRAELALHQTDGAMARLVNNLRAENERLRSG